MGGGYIFRGVWATLWVGGGGSDYFCVFFIVVACCQTMRYGQRISICFFFSAARGVLSYLFFGFFFWCLVAGGV